MQVRVLPGVLEGIMGPYETGWYDGYFGGDDDWYLDYKEKNESI